MQLNLRLILLLMVLLLSNERSNAQVCTGSLGDPVINETFGAGTSNITPGEALPQSVTTYQFVSNRCPSDGSYTIVSSLGACYSATWEAVLHDHTGDENGYMMVVNGSYDPGVFYTQTAKGDKLCPNTTYEFAAWIMNVIRDQPITTGDIEPNITFIVETVDGRPLAPPYNTGNIPQRDDAQYASPDGKFHKYGMYFTTPADGADIVVKMINNAPGGNGNDIILDDITFRPCGPVIKTGFNQIGMTDDLNFCYGDISSQTFHFRSEQDGYSDPYYQWQKSVDGGKTWADIAGATSKDADVTLTSPAAGEYLYRIGVLNGPSASLTCRIYSQPLKIFVNDRPDPHLSPETKVCDGTELRLSAQGGISYEWTGPNGFTSKDQSPLVSSKAHLSLNGTYTVTVTSNKGCSSVAATQVSVLPPIAASISGNTAICAGSSVQLQAGGGINYKWTPSTGLNRDDIPNPIASPIATTNYHVNIDNGACSTEAEVTVRVLKLPSANAGKDLAIQEGESVTINGSVVGDSVRYYWTPNDDIDNLTSPTPVVNPVDNTTYTLHVESLAGCGEATDDVFIRVYKRINIPNSFTPNGDGINDIWNIDKLYTYPDADVKVFARDGRLVYQSVGYSKPWAGTLDGRPLPAGVYYYVIDLKNETPLRSGWVMLVR